MTLGSVCHQPPLNWHDGSMNRVATAAEMTNHGLTLANASEYLTRNNRAQKCIPIMALLLEETAQPLGDKMITLDPCEPQVCYVSGCFSLMRIIVSISLPVSKSQKNAFHWKMIQEPVEEENSGNIVPTFSSVIQRRPYKEEAMRPN